MLNKEVVVVGGGFAGLLAILKLSETYNPDEITLVDEPLSSADGKLGGFAKFSGAKFSLLPAGSGLINIAGSTEKLQDRINKVIIQLGLDRFEKAESKDINHESKNIEHRSYTSYVLTPIEMDELIDELTRKLINKCTVVRQKVQAIQNKKSNVSIILSDGTELKCHKLIYAAGRKGNSILSDLGVFPTNSKGIDIGFRVEFTDDTQLKKLREIGPDAKLMWKNTRTFCLNNPGEIYWYPYEDIKIPGGVVTFKGVKKSNVGILTRRKDKSLYLDRIKKHSELINKKSSFIINNEEDLLNFKSLISKVFDHDVTDEIFDFYQYLESLKLINWKESHIIHFPLIDWHWDTYCVNKSFKTNASNVFCVGDLSGHARGLLQAAVSGILAAEEILNDV